MKLFFKHLLRSIKKRPLQPLILTLTLTLALLVCSMSLSLGGYFFQEVEKEQAARYGCADIEIGIDSKTDSRFMFSKTVKEVLGDGVLTAGRYDAPMFIDGKNGAVSGVAVDFNEIGDIFDIKFSSYGTVTQSAVDYTAFISQRFADAQGLKVGDKLKVKTFGCDAEYTVQGVTPTPIFSDCDVMVSISGIMRLLAENSLTVALLGDDFLPCNAIYVSVGERDIGECINLIKSHAEFSDKSVTEVKDKVLRTSSVEALSMISTVLVVVSCVVSAAVSFSCLYILSSERSEENATFYAVGAKRRHLNLLSCAEIILYWLVGVIISNAVIGPVMRSVIRAVGFNYVNYSFSLSTALKSGGAILLSSLLTVAAFVAVGGRTKKKKSYGRFAVSLVAAAAVFMLCFIFIPLDLKLAWSVVCNGLIVLLIITGAPTAFVKVTAWFDKILTRRVNKGNVERPSLYYGVKNVKNVRVMHNTARLAVITSALVTVMAIVLASVGQTVQTNGNYLHGSYAVVNATDRCYENVLKQDGVESAYRVGVFAFKCGDDEVQMVSASEVSAFSKSMEMERLPEGNEVYLSYAAARKYAVDIGDELTMTFGEEEFVLKYAGSFKTNVHVAVFDCTQFGLERNVVFVDKKDGVTDDELYSQVSAAVSLELSTVVDAKEFIQSRMRIGTIFYNGVKVLFPVIVGFVIIGIADNLLESYRTRRGEFELYRIAGMSKKQVRRVKATELILTFGLGILAGVLLSIPVLINLDQSLVIFAYDITNVFK